MDLIIVIHRRKEDLIMEKIKIVGEELKASMKNGEAELKEDFLKEVKDVERNLKAEVAKVNIVGEELKAGMENVEVELKEDFLKEVTGVERNLKALVAKGNNIVLEELKANMKSDKAELKEDFAKEVRSMETNLKAEVVKNLTELSSAQLQLRELIRNQEEKLKADILEEVKNVQKSVKAEILKVKTPAAEFIPECPICLHQMAPPIKIVHCVQGHKLCETCSKKEAVKSCPTCKTGFMGRDFGMEAFIRELAGEK